MTSASPGDLLRGGRVVEGQQPASEARVADAPAGIDARTHQEPEMIGRDRPAEPGLAQQSREPGIVHVTGRHQPLHHECAVEALERHDIANRCERDEIQPGKQVQPRRTGVPPFPKQPRGRHQHHEDHAGGGARLGEALVLRQEAVAGVDRLRARALGGVQDGVGEQIALAHRRGTDAVGLVGHGDVHRLGVGIGIDGDRLQAHAARRADDAAGDLATVGDEDLGKHGPGPPRLSSS